MGKRVAVPVAIAIAIGLGWALIRNTATCGRIGGTGPCDAGFPGVPAFGLGSWGWGPECSGLRPAAREASMWAASHYAHSGNVTYDAGMMLDTSLTCCKSNGDCVEMWGDDPASGNNISETPVARNYAVDGTGYGIFVEPQAIVNRLHDTRDVCTGWTGTGPACASNAYPGPFGYYLNGPGGKAMAQLTVVNDGGPQRWCQTVDAGSPNGQFAFTCWLKGDTITAARLSLTGTGDSAGDRTCTISALSDAGQGRREGCITPYSGYAAALTQIKVCVTAGAADNVSGTLGVSDCQLERDPNTIGHITMYTANTGGAGTVGNRGVGTFAFTHPDQFDAGLGCFAVGRSERIIDNGSPVFLGSLFSQLGMTATTTAGGTGYALHLSPTNNVLSNDGTNTLTSTIPGLQTQGDGGWWWLEVEWDGGAMSQWDGGSLLSSPLVAPLFVDGDDVQIGSFHATGTNSWAGQHGPVSWGTGAMCRTPPQAINSTAHRVYVIGDDWSGGGTDYNVHTRPLWSDYAQSVVTVDPWGVQSTNQVFYDGGCCDPYPSRKAKFSSGIQDSFAVWIGYNDVANGADGHITFASLHHYVANDARKGIRMYWFNLPPSGGLATAATNAFNADFANVCADGGFPGFSTPNHPEPNLTCIDVYSLLNDPSNADHVRVDYASGPFINTAGAQAIANLFLRNWP